MAAAPVPASENTYRPERGRVRVPVHDTWDPVQFAGTWMAVAPGAVGSRSARRVASTSLVATRSGRWAGGLVRTRWRSGGTADGAGWREAEASGSMAVMGSPPASGLTDRVSPWPLPDAGVRKRVGIEGRCLVVDPPSAYRTVVPDPSRAAMAASGVEVNGGSTYEDPNPWVTGWVEASAPITATEPTVAAVSYTHLTLPTIYSV